MVELAVDMALLSAIVILGCRSYLLEERLRQIEEWREAIAHWNVLPESPHSEEDEESHWESKP